MAFLREIEDRDRGDAYRRQELDANMRKREEVPSLQVNCADTGEFLRGASWGR